MSPRGNGREELLEENQGMMINEAVYRCMAVDIGLGFEEGLPGFQFFQVVGLDSLEGGEELIFGIDGCIAVV